MLVPRLLRRIADQSRAVENARVASTELARRRVEREEVEIFLARLEALAAAPHGARRAAGRR